MSTAESHDVDIVLDVACAWSYIGLTRYRKIADAHRSAGENVRTGFLPYQLDPAAPPEPQPLLDVLRDKFGEGAITDTRRVIALAKEKDGLDLRHDDAVHSNTFAAHVLIHIATRAGRGEDMAERLFRAHFTDGLDVADPAVLSRLAEEVGVAYDPADTDADAEWVRDALEAVGRSGVRGIPVFRFRSGAVVSGAPDAADLDEALGASVQAR